MSNYLQVKVAADAVVEANANFEAAFAALNDKIAEAANLVDVSLSGAYFTALNNAQEAVNLQATQDAYNIAESARLAAIETLKLVTSEYDGT